jgi:hypothetical protein
VSLRTFYRIVNAFVAKKIKWILSAGGPVFNPKFEKSGSQRIHFATYGFPAVSCSNL